MQRATDSKWELPGGKLESNEDYRQAAKRELREETGIHMHVYKAILSREREMAHRDAWVKIMYFLALEWTMPETLQAFNPQELKRVSFCAIQELETLDLTERSREELREKRIARFVV